VMLYILVPLYLRRLYWPSSAQLYSVLIPTELMTRFQCLTDLGAFTPSPLSKEPELESLLRPTVSRPVCLRIKHPYGAYGKVVITVRHLWVRWCGALSLTRGRVCRLQLLLALASAIIFRSESWGTREHILVFRIRDFPFRRLLRLAGSASLSVLIMQVSRAFAYLLLGPYWDSGSINLLQLLTCTFGGGDVRLFVLLVILNIDRLCPINNFIESCLNFAVFSTSTVARLWVYARLWPWQCACP
jgi:hypothetical protein